DLGAERSADPLADEAADQTSLSGPRQAPRREAGAGIAQLETQTGTATLGPQSRWGCAQQQADNHSEVGEAPGHGARKLTATRFGERVSAPARAPRSPGTPPG